ncbi:MAG: hypothetical protein KAJ19_15290 [Gammaproteobacteria bacterium]|nr:hypothetical protein [Gammaproteobacteria bacterium]
MPRYPYGNGQMPTPTWQNSEATLTPPTLESVRQDAGHMRKAWGIQWPAPPVPEGENVAYFPRTRTVTFQNPTINATVAQTIQFQQPTAVIARSGGAFDTQGAALPAGTEQLNTFTVLFRTLGNTNLLDDIQTMAINVLGDAKRPALIAGGTWLFNTGSSLQIEITPLRSNLRIDVTIFVVEFYGPNNFQWL